MLIDGEKYACEACIRGHRVSSCNHADRELVHVARKGRPISQCQHCRGMRKARSQHVNCQCGGAKAHSKENCPHDQHGESAADGECCCSHTSKCTCAIKKDKSLQNVTDDGSHTIHPKESPRPQSHIKNCHDNKPMVFTGNGHHKPAHKFNDAHNQLGSPYKIPSRSHTIHGHREIAQRSTDSLPLTKLARPHHESPLHQSTTQRQIKSEHNSPHLSPTALPYNVPNDFRIPAFDPGQYSYSPFTSSTPGTQANSQEDLSLEEQFPDAFFIRNTQAEDTQPQQSMDWPPYDLSSGNNLLANSGGFPSQDVPLASTEQFGNLNLGMTPPLGETFSPDEFNSVQTQPRSTSGEGSNGVSSPGESEVDRYRYSYESTPQSNILASDNLESLDIDEILRQAQEETRKMTMMNQMQQMQQAQQNQMQFGQASQPNPTSAPSQGQANPGPSTGMHPFTVHEAQQRAHSGDSIQIQEKANMAMPPVSMAEDPAWSLAPDMSNPTLGLDDAQEDEDWVR